MPFSAHVPVAGFGRVPVRNPLGRSQDAIPKQCKNGVAGLRLEERVAKPAKTKVWRSSRDLRGRNHALEVNHVELELQNQELRQANAEFEANYDDLYDSVPVGYFTLGRNGHIEKTNLSGAGMLGQPRAVLLGRRFASFVTPESIPCFNEFLRRVVGGYDMERCTVTLMKRGNTPVVAYIEATGAGPDSNCRAVVVDITSAEQARLALRESEAHLKLALAASNMGVWEWERDSGDIYWSPECFSIFGVDCFCPTLDTVAQLLHPEDAARVRSIVSQALADGKEQSVECRIIRPNGQVTWISARCQVQYNEASKSLRLIGIAQDITERKRAEQNACPEPA